MNILLLSDRTAFTHRRFGGAQSSMRLLAEQLSKNGHKVFYLTKNKKGRLLPTVETRLFDGIQVFQVHYPKGWKQSRVIAAIAAMLFQRVLGQTVIEHRIDICYLFYEIDNLQAVLKERERTRSFKVVLRMAGLHWYEEIRKNESLRAEYLAAFSQVDSVNFIHSDLRILVDQRLQELGMEIKFASSFVADIGSSVIPSQRDHVVVDRPRGVVFQVLMIARFSAYQKRQDLLVQAMNLLVTKGRSDIRIEFVGEGGTRAALEAQVRNDKLESNVIFSDFVSQKDLWDKMRRADLICQACEYEGLGKIIIESMALGIPILVSDVVPLNGYIVDGVNGFLVKNAPIDWANRIEQLADNRTRLNSVSESAVAFIKEYYDSAKNVEKYQDAFQRLLESDF